jgi:hypothetical protein
MKNQQDINQNPVNENGNQSEPDLKGSGVYAAAKDGSQSKDAADSKRAKNSASRTDKQKSTTSADKNSRQSSSGARM